MNATNPEDSSPDSVLPFISVVTLTMGPGDDLWRTRASLLEQVRADFEWVVVNGAAALDENALRLHNVPLTLLERKGRGIYKDMNYGADHSRGRILVFLNAGDHLEDPLALWTLQNLSRGQLWGYAGLRVENSAGTTLRTHVSGRFSGGRFRYGLSHVPHP